MLSRLPPKSPDVLIQALNPSQKAISDKARLDQIMKKYGKDTKPLAAPPEQWEGDNAS